MILTVTLNAAVARTLVVPSLTIGQRHRAPESITLAGGKGINVARSLRTLGVPVLATGFAGGRNGDAVRDGLSAAAIPFDLVEIEGHSRTSTAIIDPMAGTQTEINEYGPEVTPAEAKEFSRRLEHLMEYATAVVGAESRAQGEPLAREPQPERGRERRWLRLYRGRGLPPGPLPSGRARGRQCVHHLSGRALLPEHRERGRLGACPEGRNRLHGG